MVQSMFVLQCRLWWMVVTYKCVSTRGCVGGCETVVCCDSGQVEDFIGFLFPILITSFLSLFDTSFYDQYNTKSQFIR